MKICLLGNNLTNLVLANVLVNKKLFVDIVYWHNFTKKESSRTLSISKDNYEYLKKLQDNFNVYAWPTEKIKIYNERSKLEELFEFENKKKRYILFI